MKKILFFTILLIFLFCLCSCTNNKALYEKGKYEQVLNNINSKDSLDADSLKLKIKCLLSLNKTEGLKESSLLYMLMSDPIYNSQLPEDLIDELNFSDALNVLLFNPTGGLNTQIKLYKSYINLGKIEEAKFILENYLISSMDLIDFSILIANNSFDDNYTFEFFSTWYSILNNDSDIDNFLDSFYVFICKCNNKDIHILCSSLLTQLEQDNIFKSSRKRYAKVLYIKGKLSSILGDSISSDKYYKISYRLYPDISEVFNSLE